jgi:YD repeat-containing protein
VFSWLADPARLPPSKRPPLPLTLTSLLLTFALSVSASPTQRGDIEAVDIAQSLEALRIELSLHADRNRQQEIRRDSTGTQTTDYAIDQDDRLIGSTVTDASGSVTITYTLDGVGNRLHETVQHNGSTLSDITYHYQAQHRLIDTHDRVSGLVTEYTYDDRGQLISETTNGQTTTYRPNAQDRLATLTLPGAPPVDYRYDPEGKRIERRTTTEVTRYGWDGAHLRRETNVANNLLDSHDWAAGQILQSRHLATSLLVSVRDIGAEPLEGGLPSGDGGFRWRCWLLCRSRCSFCMECGGLPM